MSVYVDDMYTTPMGQFGRMKMSHMLADSTEELLAMADTIGLSRRWIQNAGTPTEHFDVSMGKRKLAIEAGAVEITMAETGRMVASRRGGSHE